MEQYVADNGLGSEEDPRFPIMDFYLSMCSTYNIYGVVSEDLQMIDVGKLDSLDAAERFACGL